MSGKPELIPKVLAYTSEVTAARPWGIVTGTGDTPEAALRSLRRNAGEQGIAIFGRLWEQSGEPAPRWRETVETKAGRGAKLNASFSIGSTRLAYGESAWVAYGTLFTDGTGDGTEWLQREGGPDGS